MMIRMMIRIKPEWSESECKNNLLVKIICQKLISQSQMDQVNNLMCPNNSQCCSTVDVDLQDEKTALFKR